MNNIIPLRATPDAKALYQAIPHQEPELDMFSPEAEALYEALAMLEPGVRDAVIEETGDRMLVHYYRLWLEQEAAK